MSANESDDQAADGALLRYIAHRGAGRHEAALRAASDACHAAPNRPEPHYAYGEAWTSLGRHADAARAFAEAIRLAPKWADAWVNLGFARYREGGIEDAKLAMRQALLRAPGHPVASANLAAFMRIAGEAEAAESLLRDIISVAPDNAAARLNLAADLLQEERADEALALLGPGLAPPDDPPTLRHWHLQRVLALFQLRRFDEAEAELAALDAAGSVPPAIAPLWHWRRVLLAEGREDAAGAAREARAMETALNAMGSDAVPEHRIMGHYDLAKFWSGRGEHAQAFEHWRAGHALLTPTQPFSREAHDAWIGANIALLNRTRLTEGPRASNDDPAPVFIVGMPRSGTTLCEQILDAHPNAHGAGERSALSRTFVVLGGDGRDAVARIAALDTPALDAAAAGYLADLHALAPSAARVVDKMPANYLYLGLAALLLPGAKFIHCVRDPRDIGLSIFTFRFHGAHGYAHDLSDLGWTIARQVRLMDHWKAVLGDRVTTVALHDWVRDFDGTLARVLGHVDLAHDPACERFYERDSRVRTVSRAQVRQPVNARGLGRWRPYAAELAPLIAELEAAGILAAWGVDDSE